LQDDVTSISGPNGNIHWLNCGVDGAGWNPPRLTVNDIKTLSLEDAVKDPNSPFHACQDFIGLFNQYGGQFNCACWRRRASSLPDRSHSASDSSGLYLHAGELV
jgi:hypothetical protein